MIAGCLGLAQTMLKSLVENKVNSKLFQETTKLSRQLSPSAIHGFTISFPFRKLHSFYYDTQQLRLKQTRVIAARRRREAMVKR